MWAFIKKEFLYIFRDYRTMLILFGMPLAQILLFGFAITNDINNAHIAVLDQSKDVVTREITRKLLSSHYFILDRYLKSEKEIKSAFRRGEIKEVVVFEKDFAQKMKTDGEAHVQLLLDASDPNTANILNSYTEGIINSYIFQHQLQEGKIPLRIDVESTMEYNQELKSVFMFVPGIITVILMLVSAMMTSITIVREKELGTMEALLVSPVRPGIIILGKVVPYVVLSFINLVVILLMSQFVFGMPIRGSAPLLLAESLLFLVMSLSLGILISTVSKTQQQAMMLSMFGLMLPTILLSGFIFPIANMPVVLQWLSDLMPGKWFIIIIKNIMLKGIGFSYFWKETLIIFAMTALFVVLSIKRFNIRLEE
ncbi:ABC transporter permease [Candidatus Sulfidibacterium hydrothermale]|uniref:ABC transporter permease n=1 Tax=Candidatus Sulfidibacterium hydrothermale TaxID=2875962 RepID=UPI001F0B6D12|nr:ABC transporter permease [Candidatus Sulfidibacterium hydrothermale]UBM62302.1 ABC transporter permease [Candidatus Sulfidibacterium hydrothermale]